MLLILMCGDVAMNPGPVMLGLVNVRAIQNKGPLLADTIASHTFDFLCLTETRIRTTDSDSFLRSLTPDGFSLIHMPRSSGIGGGFFIRDSYKYRKVDTPNYSSFENMVISDHAVIKCAIHFPSSVATCQTRISYSRYHRINMSDFRSDLKEMPFVKCPANSVSQLYDQYTQDLSRILDRHAPLVSSLKTKPHADWLSETYRLAKSLKRQFERAWRKDKSQYNRSCLTSNCLV